MTNKLKKIADIDAFTTVIPVEIKHEGTNLLEFQNGEYSLKAPGVDTMWLMSNQSIMIETGNPTDKEQRQFFIPMGNIIQCSRVKEDDK